MTDVPGIPRRPNLWFMKGMIAWGGLIQQRLRNGDCRRIAIEQVTSLSDLRIFHDHHKSNDSTIAKRVLLSTEASSLRSVSSLLSRELHGWKTADTVQVQYEHAPDVSTSDIPSSMPRRRQKANRGLEVQDPSHASDHLVRKMVCMNMLAVAGQYMVTASSRWCSDVSSSIVRGLYKLAPRCDD